MTRDPETWIPAWGRNDIRVKLEDFCKQSWSFAMVSDGKILYKSKSQGLKPLVFCFKKYKRQMQGAVVFDKIVGRAAALLLVLGGVEKLITPIISRGALVYLRKNGVMVEYGKIVKNIMNRAGMDLCPMEKLSEGKGAEELLMILDVKTCLGNPKQVLASNSLNKFGRQVDNWA